MQDLELTAMQSINSALASLDDADAIRRVLEWAASRHGVSLGDARGPTTRDAAASSADGSGTEMQFHEIADLFDAASPSNEAEKALIVGYWFQVVQGRGDFDSLSVNSELKNLGHGVSNITKAFEYLIAKKPRLVIQTKKSGTSQQARKRYKLTIEGIRSANAMIAREAAEALDT